MTATQSVTLNLPTQQAKFFQKMTTQQKDVVASFVINMFDENGNINLMELMDYIGFRAQKRGLTPEILESGEFINLEIA
jgi:hypothetical protein